MCGIGGIVDFNKNINSTYIKSMIHPLVHRGPDDEGMLIREFDLFILGLGQKRLSVIDLTKGGHQPKSFLHFDLVFNGEIYNYKEIRNILIEKGYTFDSESDSEVILKSFDYWGEDCVSKFIGMFAFCIFDNMHQRIYLCRDRVGVKPLYFYQKGDVFMFASELKAFSASGLFDAEIDMSAVSTFIQFGYIPSPYCIYKYTYKLEPGSWGVLECKTKEFKVYKYWSVQEVFSKTTLDISYPEAVEEAEKLLISACKYRMEADVPAGVFLSGGYDSSLVAALLTNSGFSELKTFTVGFPEGNDESQDAKRIASFLGTNHTTLYCSTKEAKEIIPDLPDIYDEPCGDISCIPTILVSRLAKKEVKVALSADGGDESFAGYNGYYNTINRLNKIKAIPSLFNPLINTAANILNSTSIGDISLAHKLRGWDSFNKSHNVHQFVLNSSKIPDRIIQKIMLNSPISDLYEPIHNIADVGNNILLSHFCTFLPDYLLVKVDRATMSSSLEAREPLLDHRVIEFAADLPFIFKNDGKESKKIIKDIVHKYIPSALMNRPKTGFDLPIYDWLRTDLQWVLDEYLNKSSLNASGLFNVNEILDMVHLFKKGKLKYKSVLWNIIIFQMWYKRWINTI